MATSSASETMDPAPYTPAGDIEAVLTDLEGIDVDRDADDRDDQGAEESTESDQLGALDDALVELAATIDDVDADDGTSADADETTAPHAASVLRRQRAEFQSVAESTDVDSVPFDDAATFLASDLYAVPPANTRFQWVDDDALGAN